MIDFNISKNTLLLQCILNSSFEKKKEFFYNNYLSYINIATAENRCYYSKALNYAILMISNRLIKQQHNLSYHPLIKKPTQDISMALPVDVVKVKLQMATYYMNLEEQKNNRYLTAFILHRLKLLQKNKVFFNFANEDYEISVGKIFLDKFNYSNSALEVSKKLLVSTPNNILLTLKLIDKDESLNYSYEQILNLLIIYMLRYEIEYL